jgi:HTH-type transcriptional regulator / antitoxin HigA
MTSITTRRARTRPSARYLALVRAFPLRPIRSEPDLDRAAGVIDKLLDRPALGQDERDYLDVLSSLVEQFEESRHPIAAAPDADLLAHLLEARGVTQSQVARDTSIAESTLSAVLRGTRTLTRQHIARLAGYFRVSPAAFDFEAART